MGTEVTSGALSFRVAALGPLGATEGLWGAAPLRSVASISIDRMLFDTSKLANRVSRPWRARAITGLQTTTRLGIRAKHGKRRSASRGAFACVSILEMIRSHAGTRCLVAFFSRWASGLLCLAMLGCGGGARQVRNAGLYAAPSGPIFVVANEESQGSTMGAPVADHENLGWQSGHSYTAVHKSWVIEVDPRSGARTQLGWVKHLGSGGLEPFYWDAGRRILWVSVIPSHRIVGLIAGGVVFPGQDERIVVMGKAPGSRARGEGWRSAHALPAPFAYVHVPDEAAEGPAKRSARLWNAMTGTFATIGLPAMAPATETLRDPSGWTRDGKQLRYFRWIKIGEQIGLSVLTVDWGGAPQTTGPTNVLLPQPEPGYAARRGHALTADGRYLLELIQGEAGAKLNIAPIDGAPPSSIALDLPPPTGSPHSLYRILPLYDDAVLVGYDESGYDCVIGELARAASGNHSPLPDGSCLSGTANRQLLPYDSAKNRYTFVDARAVLHGVKEGGPARRVAPHAIIYTYRSPKWRWLHSYRLDLDTGETRALTPKEAQMFEIDWRQGDDAFIPFLRIAADPGRDGLGRPMLHSWSPGGAAIEVPSDMIGDARGVELNDRGDLVK